MNKFIDEPLLISVLVTFSFNSTIEITLFGEEFKATTGKHDEATT